MLSSFTSGKLLFPLKSGQGKKKELSVLQLIPVAVALFTVLHVESPSPSRCSNTFTGSKPGENAHIQATTE